MRRVPIALCLAAAAIFVPVSAGAPAPTSLATSHIAIVGGAAAQRALAILTAARVGGVMLSRVSFRSPTTGLRHQGVRGTEMVVSSRVRGTVRTEWEQQLFVGTYLAYVARRPKARIAAVSAFQSEGPIGRFTTLDVYGSNPKAIVISRFTRRLLDAAARAHAQVVEERVAALPARAIALTIRVSDPAAFLKHRATSLLRILEPLSAPILGYYFGVEDASGTLVFATSHLANSGALYVLRSLDSCSPVGHSEPEPFLPPPCPAQ